VRKNNQVFPKIFLIIFENFEDQSVATRHQ